MAHLDVYANPHAESAGFFPFLLDVQSNLLSDLPTCMVIPLMRPQAVESMPIMRLNPKITVNGESLILLTQDMASVPHRMLKMPVANLASQRDDILAALDFLFVGF